MFPFFRALSRNSQIARLMKKSVKCSPRIHVSLGFALLFGMAAPVFIPSGAAQTVTPQLVDSNLNVRSVITGLSLPTSMAFTGANEFFVLEKATGRVQRVVNGVVHSTVLDLAVNSGSER